MRQVFIKNHTHPLPQPISVSICNSFINRLRGFMFQRQIPVENGLLFIQGNESRINSAIHMFFVNFDLAVIWLDNHNCVVNKCLAQRWRPFYMPSGKAKMILELHPTHLDKFSIGDKVSFDNG